jgi:uncharacterized membrane protein YhaH (DUF805 family)
VVGLAFPSRARLSFWLVWASNSLLILAFIYLAFFFNPLAGLGHGGW